MATFGITSMTASSKLALILPWHPWVQSCRGRKIESQAAITNYEQLSTAPPPPPHINTCQNPKLVPMYEEKKLSAFPAREVLEVKGLGIS